METLNQAGILPVQNYPTLQLKGQGVLIGFLDSGIDYTSRLFRNLDGSTRIAAIWDQTIQSGTPPQGFAYGTEYARETINAALSSEDPALLFLPLMTPDTGDFCCQPRRMAVQISPNSFSEPPLNVPLQW